MVIIKEKKNPFSESLVKHGTEFAADSLSKKASMLQNEIFNIFNSSDGTRDIITKLYENIWMQAVMAFLYNRVLFLRPKGVKFRPGDIQVDNIALQAANETDAALSSSSLRKYIIDFVSFRKRFSIPEMTKYARMYFAV